MGNLVKMDRAARRRMERTERRFSKEECKGMIVLKDVPREERKNLPPEVKIVLFTLTQTGTISPEVAIDCLTRFPEYFENPEKTLKEIGYA